MENVSRAVQLIVDTTIWKSSAQLIQHHSGVVLGKTVGSGFCLQVGLHIVEHDNDLNKQKLIEIYANKRKKRKKH
jgi:hypothetical protein